MGDEICGVVISIRPTEDIISLWNRTAADPAITARIRCGTVESTVIAVICVGSSVGRALCLEYRVSWVRVPPEAVFLLPWVCCVALPCLFV